MHCYASIPKVGWAAAQQCESKIMHDGMVGDIISFLINSLLSVIIIITATHHSDRSYLDHSVSSKIFNT